MSELPPISDELVQSVALLLVGARRDLSALSDINLLNRREWRDLGFSEADMADHPAFLQKLRSAVKALLEKTAQNGAVSPVNAKTGNGEREWTRLPAIRK